MRNTQKYINALLSAQEKYKHLTCMKVSDSYYEINIGRGRGKYASLGGLDKYGTYIISDSENVYYVGCAYDRFLNQRIKQHFREEDRGSLLWKMRNQENNAVEMLKDSEILYVGTKDGLEALFLECYLIGCLQPIWNF